MNPANYEFLEANYDCYTEVIRAETATKANGIKYELARIMREEFISGYVYADSCGNCLFDMVRLLFRLFDEWKAEQLKIAEQQTAASKLEVDEMDKAIRDGSADINATTIQVEASFPANDKPETDTGNPPTPAGPAKTVENPAPKNKNHRR